MMDSNTCEYLSILFNDYEAALEKLEKVLKQLGASVPFDVMFCDFFPLLDNKPDFVDDVDYRFLCDMRNFNAKAGGGKLYFQNDIQKTRFLRLWLKYVYERK